MPVGLKIQSVRIGQKALALNPVKQYRWGFLHAGGFKNFRCWADLVILFVYRYCR